MSILYIDNLIVTMDRLHHVGQRKTAGQRARRSCLSSAYRINLRRISRGLARARPSRARMAPSPPRAVDGPEPVFARVPTAPWPAFAAPASPAPAPPDMPAPILPERRAPHARECDWRQARSRSRARSDQDGECVRPSGKAPRVLRLTRQEPQRLHGSDPVLEADGVRVEQ